MNDGPPALPAKRTSWWGRNWIWVAVLGSVAAVACFLGLFAAIRQSMTRSEPYQRALATAQASPKVVEALGSPVRDGFWVQGHFRSNLNGGGKADLTIPLKGPKGGGAVLVSAVRAGGAWKFQMLAFRAAGSDVYIDLHPELKAKEQP